MNQRIQSEHTLEENLIRQLVSLGWERASIKNEVELVANLKTQLEKHNEELYSQQEFEKIKNHLSKGNVFEKAKRLREDPLTLNRQDGSSTRVEFINQINWCQNEYQVASQISQEGAYHNRYDVTLLVNGLPLAQIELKRRGMELKEAFNQINRYHKHSFSAGLGLFQYVQIFVISNGVNTKYYANNKKQSFKQTCFWADKDNKRIDRLEEFADNFLEKCHLSKMITHYTVLHESDKVLMVLRPYQYYAVEAIVDKVKHSSRNGYIWHTTGSGKTLTSFKASKIISRLPGIEKTVFVVDRKDLDDQTIREFNAFEKDCVDATQNTRNLVNQFKNPDQKLVVTTIQKLNTAISSRRYLNEMEQFRSSKVVFIFDECHRSQFGTTHARIKRHFSNNQMFGFTGTPIFEQNALLKGQTTPGLFEDLLHSYKIVNAIRDENVLGFSVEYVGKYKNNKAESSNYLDIGTETEVSADKVSRQVLESDQRLEKIVDYIITNHQKKTQVASSKFNAIFCVSSTNMACRYYEIFRRKKETGEHNLKIATIFSFQTNEDDIAANGLNIDNEPDLSTDNANTHTRDKLQEYIGDYNQMFGSNFTTSDSQSFYNYYRDVAKKVRNATSSSNGKGVQVLDLDILIVVNMFLTGFDSKPLNTLYVDKNLRFHGLIQAYSRTNRILNETKTQGNIVCFRNLKPQTDEALQLFAKDANAGDIFTQPYEEILKQFKQVLGNLYSLTPVTNEVNNLDEIGKEEFVKIFRNLLRLKTRLTTFADFEEKDLDISPQDFEDYKSKYLDIYDEVKRPSSEGSKEVHSNLQDLDFELELIHTDKVTVSYILKLLTKLAQTDEKDREKTVKSIMDIVRGDAKLRKKQYLIQNFINQKIPTITNPEDVENSFEEYVEEEKEKVFDQTVKEENLQENELRQLIENFIENGREPRREEVRKAFNNQPSIIKLIPIADRVKQFVVDFVEIYIDGLS